MTNKEETSVKLLNSFGPNPRMVRMFMLEKGIKLPFEEVDLFGAENRKEAYLSKNPAGGIPCLILDDGTPIAETAAICEYLEELNPTPALIGTNPKERAETRMMVRRVEMNVTEFIYNSFRFGPGIEIFKDRTRCLPEASDGLKNKALDGLVMIDKGLAGKKYLCGNRLTLADLILYACVDFAPPAWFQMDPKLKNLHAWFDTMSKLPSAEKSLTSNWKDLGMRG